jgi:hypothetical protein
MDVLTCSLPPALDDDAISSIIDGTVSTEIHHHLEHCIYCRQRVADARRVEEFVAANTHPTPELLVDYAEGIAPPDQCYALAAHLAVCHRCAAEVQAWGAYREALLDDAADPAVPARLFGRENPYQQAEDPLALTRIAAKSPMRSGTEEPLNFRFEAQSHKYHLLLSLKWMPTSRELTGFLLAAPDTDPEPWDGTVVLAQQNSGIIEPAVVDAIGHFQLDEVSAGPLTLIITAPDGRRLSFENLILPSTE